MAKRKVQLIERQDRIVEAKVKVGAVVAGLTGLALSLIATFTGGDVPGAVAQIITYIIATFVPGLVTFAAGWLTKHTPVRVDVVSPEGRITPP